MDTTLAAEARPDTGKGAARKLRATGKIPAVLYADGGEATPLTVDPKALTTIFKRTKNRNTIIELEIGGDKVQSIVKDAQRHPVSREILHVDFLRVGDDKTIEVMVPVRGVGRPAGAALGGRLRIIRRELKARCTYDRIPEFFDVDVTPMNIGDMVKASAVPRPEGVEIVYDRDFNIISCYGKKKSGK